MQIKSMLAWHYVETVFNEYGVRTSIPTKQMAKFYALEQLLQSEGIAAEYYAKTVAELLKNWCLDKGVAYPPASVFIGEYAFNKFMKLRSKVSVELIEVDNQLTRVNLAFYTEVLLFTTYFGAMCKGQLVQEADILDAYLNSKSEVITPEWKVYVKAGKRPELVAWVINEMTLEARYFNTKKVVANYLDFLTVYARNVDKQVKKYKAQKRNKVRWGNMPIAQRTNITAELKQLETVLKNLRKVLNA